jgi:hypothetical protein
VGQQSVPQQRDGYVADCLIGSDCLSVGGCAPKIGPWCHFTDLSVMRPIGAMMSVQHWPEVSLFLTARVLVLVASMGGYAFLFRPLRNQVHPVRCQ